MRINVNTHLAFLTFDSSIHLYHFSEKKPHMMVCSVRLLISNDFKVITDIESPELPAGHNFLIPLHAHRAAVDKLLSILPAMFRGQTQPQVGYYLYSCLFVVSCRVLRLRHHRGHQARTNFGRKGFGIFMRSANSWIGNGFKYIRPIPYKH